MPALNHSIIKTYIFSCNRQDILQDISSQSNSPSSFRVHMVIQRHDVLCIQTFFGEACESDLVVCLGPVSYLPKVQMQKITNTFSLLGKIRGPLQIPLQAEYLC